MSADCAVYQGFLVYCPEIQALPTSVFLSWQWPSLLCAFRLPCAMAPHWTAQELDKMRGWRELTPQEVHQRLKRGRDQRNLATPNIKQVRKAIAGKRDPWGKA